MCSGSETGSHLRLIDFGTVTLRLSMREGGFRAEGGKFQASGRKSSPLYVYSFSPGFFFFINLTSSCSDADAE